MHRLIKACPDKQVLNAQTDQENNDKAYFLSNTGHTETQKVLHAQTDQENNNAASFLSYTGHTQPRKVLDDR